MGKKGPWYGSRWHFGSVGGCPDSAMEGSGSVRKLDRVYLIAPASSPGDRGGAWNFLSCSGFHSFCSDVKKLGRDSGNGATDKSCLILIKMLRFKIKAKITWIIHEQREVWGLLLSLWKVIIKKKMVTNISQCTLNMWKNRWGHKNCWIVSADKYWNRSMKEVGWWLLMGFRKAIAHLQCGAPPESQRASDIIPIFLGRDKFYESCPEYFLGLQFTPGKCALTLMWEHVS